MEKSSIISLIVGALFLLTFTSCNQLEGCDDRIVGIWALENIDCKVVASDPTLAKVLEEKLKDQIVYFADTMQFFTNGHFLEGDCIMEACYPGGQRKEITTGTTYDAANGELEIRPMIFFPYAGKQAKYELEGNEVMKLSAEVPEYFLNQTYLEKLGINTSDLRIDKIEYIQQFKRMRVYLADTQINE